jgi:hypothetical protein
LSYECAYCRVSIIILTFLQDAFKYQCSGSNINISREWTLRLPISVHHSTVSYDFDTKFGDIFFSVEFETQDGDHNIIIESERVNSDEHTQSGYFRLHSPGVVTLTWNNSFSWLKHKLLTYAVIIDEDRVSLNYSKRVNQSRSELIDVSSNMSLLRDRLAVVSGMIHKVAVEDIPELEREFIRLTKQLMEKREGLNKCVAEKNKIVADLKTCDSVKRGLFLRCVIWASCNHQQF